MKNSFSSFAFLFIVVSLFFTNALFAQKHLVAEPEDPSTILISKEEINDYLDKFEMSEIITIHQMLIAEHKGQPYLLAQDRWQGWIYIMELKQKKNGLFLKKSRTLNACESEDLSIDVFNVSDGKIQGCREANHKITSIQILGL
ncbi:MAG: hypothetical protein RQ756_01740 [Flavobacteriaceae bacterium]|nr:hypothetical protein [Flavobacteriaceae bacterium]